jgi:hypothetical protein
MARIPVALMAIWAVGLPQWAPAAELGGGTLSLEPAGPAAAVQAGAGSLRLVGLLGQSASGRSDADGQLLQSGFITPEGAPAGDAIFADGFEETTP